MPTSILTRAIVLAFLLHYRHASTGKALPKVIRHYEQRGIRLVGLDELLRR